MKKLIFVFIAFFMAVSSLTVNAQDSDIQLAEESVVEEVSDEFMVVTDPFAGLEDYIRTMVENDVRKKTVKEAMGVANRALLIPVISIIFTFLFPIIVIFIVFYTKHKDKKAKYALAEKALAAGQEIPKDLFQLPEEKTSWAKGIKNMCLGIALAIFLWAIIGEFWAACIGLIIFFNGLGQFLIYKMKPADTIESSNRKNNRKDHSREREHDFYVEIDRDHNGNQER